MKSVVSAIVQKLRPRERFDSQKIPSSFKKAPPNPNRDFQAAMQGAGVTGYETYN